jgi:hypothetical protein
MPGQNESSLARLPIAALAAFLCACGQWGDDRVTGTSTSVGTSIGGTAMLSGGSPAVGARVAARSDELAYKDGKPEGRMLDSAVADAQGRFTLPALRSNGFHLEITCDPAAGCASAESIEVYYQAYPVVRNRSLGELRTAPPGGLKGIIDVTSASGDSALWIGIEGTGHFAKLEDAGDPDQPGLRTFTLEGIYPGEYLLTTTAPSDTGPGESRKMTPYAVESGTVIDIGEVH